MKKMMKYLFCVAFGVLLVSAAASAQKVNQERMQRDIEVAENVLATLIKQHVNQQRVFYGLEVDGTYQEGYGVTFRVPGDYSMPFVLTTGGKTAMIYREAASPTIVEARERDEAPRAEAYALREKQAVERQRASLDSLRDEYNKRVIQAAKEFLVDYSDFLSQVPDSERIVITNQHENRSFYFVNNKRSHLSVEASRADITSFKQGKLSRDQVMSKIKVVNTETVEVKEMDLELLSSIFGRLYQRDLSTTYFTNRNLYYERLKDYGVVFYMDVFSSEGDAIKVMPTLGNAEMDEPTRNKKVTELYPKFEREFIENLLEYGRTVKSLKDDEVLVFNITMTKCAGCGIPASLELSVKNSVLKELASGRIDKNTAIGRVTVKKGPNQ